MRFRKAALADIPELAKMERESFAEPWNERMIAEELANPYFTWYVLEDAEKLLGYYGFWAVADSEAHVGTVCVRGGERGKGYGDELVSHAVAEARAMGLTAMTLEARRGNAPALKLYRKHGFEAAGIRPGYYPDGEDAVIMWLIL